MKIEHVALYVTDLEKAKDFFVTFLNGKANAGDETISKLCNAFALNPDYFYGRSEYITLFEKSEAKMNEELRQSQELLNRTGGSYPDPSSIMNAALAAQMKTIESLEQQIINKENLICVIFIYIIIIF